MTESGPMDQRDVELLGQVRALFGRLDPVPAGLTERVKFALTVQALHAEVAELVALAPALVRGPTQAETVPAVSFRTDSLSIMLTVTASGPGPARIDGWLTCGAATVEVTGSDGVVREGSADEGGRFVVDDVPRGTARLLVHQVDARPVITPEFTV